MGRTRDKLRAFHKLPPKLQVYVKGRMEGMSRTASAAAAGANNPQYMGSIWGKREDVQEAIRELTEAFVDEIGFTRKDAHDMLMQAYMNASTAAEQIQAVNALVSLHALAKPKVVEHKHEHDHRHTGAIEHLPTEELLKLAELEDMTLEGEYEEVDPAEAEPKLIEETPSGEPREDY